MKKGYTAVPGKTVARPYREKSQHGRVHKKSEHGRVHRGNADTAVHTLCTLVEFCTAAHAFLDGLFICVHFTSGIRLACFPPWLLCATAVAPAAGSQLSMLLSIILVSELQRKHATAASELSIILQLASRPAS